MVVCHCHRVNDRTINEVAARQGHTLEAIAQGCKAGSQCGGCRDTIQQLLERRDQPTGRPSATVSTVGSLP